MLRKLLKGVGALALIAVSFGGASTVAAPTAGAQQVGTIRADLSSSCGLAPVSPNSIEVCSTWTPSQQAGLVYKIDATHHYGWWGPNFDNGTWHVIIYAYYANGTLLGQTGNFDVGDNIFPIVQVNSGVQTEIYLDGYGHYPAANQNHPHYNRCVYGDATPVKTWFADQRGTNNWGSFAWYQTWPYGQVSGGGQCQIGNGSMLGTWSFLTGATGYGEYVLA